MRVPGLWAIGDLHWTMYVSFFYLCFCHARESGNPGFKILHQNPWMPAYAGMTEG